MNDLKFAVAKTPILGHLVLAMFRAQRALGYFHLPLLNFVKWLFRSKEVTNFTYDLEHDNKRYLASLIADVLNMDVFVIESYIREIDQNQILKDHIAAMISKSEMAFIADKDVQFGRRIGWYAFARAMKPKVIVETGVDKGLGSCVLTAALRKNKEEGFEGRYYGTDIDPKAGYLFSGGCAEFGHIVYGDSIETLKSFERTIDLFINDSDHSAEYEAAEYLAIENRLSRESIVLGDNSHCTDKLFRFSVQTGRRFVFFQERPAGHWYPGAGIGISFNR